MRHRIVALLGITVATTLAAERKPLPELKALPLAAGIGVASSASTVLPSALSPSAGQWVLVYVDSDCGVGCRIVLNALNASTPISGVERLVVIVAGPNSASRERVRKLNPHLARANWFEDPDRAIFQALELNHLPVTIGLQHSIVQWSIGGATSSAEVRSRIAAWIGR